MKKVAAFLLLVMASFFVAPVSYADEASDMKSEIAALKARLADLETKVAAGSSAPAGPVVALPSMMEGIGISGYVDSTYSYNFASPDTAVNVGRVFDRHANSFNLSAAELDIMKSVSADSRVGFRTDLFFGNDAEVIHSAGLGTATDNFDLEQAYVNVLVPTSSVFSGLQDTELKIGKFVTLLGAEVIESKDNWNSTRGLAFGFAIPFTHTGVLANQPFTLFDQPMHVSGGIVNGWDNVDDNNSAKTALWQYGIDGIALPGESKLTVLISGVAGAEQAASDSSMRNVTDVVLIYNTPWKPLTLMYNYDYGHEDNLIVDPNSASSQLVDDATWSAHAVYARFDINDKWSISGRYELFNDDNHARFALIADELWEATGTLEFRPWKGLITRVEYRHDDADANVFNDGAILSDTQDTITGQAIFAF